MGIIRRQPDNGPSPGLPHRAGGSPGEKKPPSLDRKSLHELRALTPLCRASFQLVFNLARSPRECRSPKIIRRILYPDFSQAFWLPPLQKVSQQFPSARSIFLQLSR